LRLPQLQTPADKLYQQGVPFQPERIVRGIKLETTTPHEVERSVDWNNIPQQDQDVDYAAASATSHFHYQKLSNLLLCDKVLADARNVPEPVRRAARLMAERNAQEFATWSKYMKHSGGGGTICQEQKEYYQVLFTQHDVLPALLGVQTWNVALDPTYDEFHTAGNPVFQKLTGGFAQNNPDVYTPIRDAFRDAIQQLSMDERKQLLQSIAQQVDLMAMTKQQRDDDIYHPLNSTADHSVDRAGKRVKAFYQEIGLTKGVF
jgi:hypothetical protein